MSDTRLRAADLADEFRSISSDKRIEYVPAQAVHLLIAADMLEEFAHTPKCEECEAMFNCEDCAAMLDCDECLRADSSQKERKRVDYENAKLRELVRELYEDQCDECDEWKYRDRMRELGVEVDA